MVWAWHIMPSSQVSSDKGHNRQKKLRIERTNFKVPKFSVFIHPPPRLVGVVLMTNGCGFDDLSDKIPSTCIKFGVSSQPSLHPGMRLISGLEGATSIEEAEAFSWQNGVIDIYSNSWGPIDTGDIVEGPQRPAFQAIANGVTNVSCDQ